jgi:hypothetical protein
MEINAVILSKSHSEIRYFTLKFSKILLDDLPFVACADNKLLMTEMGVISHNVPKDGPISNLDHGLGAKFGFLPKPGA